MKKTILFAMMAAVLGFTACSKEEPAQTEPVRKGMVLHATVAQPEDTKATFTDNEGIWHFDYAENDQITVTNKQISTYYTFTYNGTDFISTDAEPTSEPTRWYAYYPSNEVSLVGQTGKWEDLAHVYALVGSTTYGKDVTGEDGLDITMDPKCAVLKIINQKGSIDINVMHKDNGYWIKGLTDSQASFVLSLAETKQTLLSTTEVGTYYVAVPAGTPLTVYDGEEAIRSTSKGLTAGKYYELSLTTFTIIAKQDPEHKADYFSTFYSSQAAFKVPDNVNAYIGEVKSTDNTDARLLLKRISGGIIPAGEPVILKSTQSRIVLEYSAEPGSKSEINMLSGINEATTLGPNDYAMSLGQQGVGFYLWDDKTLGANSAYLHLNASASAKAFTFQFDDGD